MNHVTRGLETTSGMLATGGLGRRIIAPFVELVRGAYIQARARVFAVPADPRNWTWSGATRVYRLLTDTTRIWHVPAAPRDFIVRAARSFTTKVKRVWRVITGGE